MSLQDAMKNFDYPQAIRDLGLSPSSTTLWQDLYHRCCSQNPRQSLSLDQLYELQCLHDLAWALSRIDPPLWSALDALRDGIQESLRQSFGPYIFQCLSKANISLEGFLLPLLKTPHRDSGFGEVLDQFAPGICSIHFPTREFAGCFARCFVEKAIVSKLRAYPIPPNRQADRFFLGWEDGCQVCNSAGVDRNQIDRQIDQTRQDARKAARSSRTSGVTSQLVCQLIRFLGAKENCPRCFGTGFDVHGLDSSVLLRMSQENFDGPNLPWDAHFCPDCFGGGNWQAALDTPIAGNPSKTVADLLQEATNGQLSIQALKELLGEGILCKHCARWIQILPQAQKGWVCPIVDGFGDIHAYARLE